MGDKGHGGHSFDQSASLVDTIRNILNRYPAGFTVLKELLQNADDAGARDAFFCIDFRSFPEDGLIDEKLAPFQRGPALLCYNDKRFEEKDLRSIQQTGNSCKKNDTQKTGQFGLGFKSVYHLTDVPSFVTGDVVVFFDALCKYLPGNETGLQFNIKQGSTSYPNQFSPLAGFGCDMKSTFEGTLFRFPLRKEEQVLPRDEGLSRQFYNDEIIGSMVQEFCNEAKNLLFFLNHVRRVKVFVWKEGRNAPQELYSAEIDAINSIRGEQPLLSLRECTELRQAEDYVGVGRMKVVEKRLNDEELRDALLQELSSFSLVRTNCYSVMVAKTFGGVSAEELIE